MQQLSYRLNPATREQELIRDAKKSETSAQRAGYTCERVQILKLK